MVSYIQNLCRRKLPNPGPFLIDVSPEVDRSWTELLCGVPFGEGRQAAEMFLLPSPGGHLDGFDPLSALLGGGRLQKIVNFVSSDDLKEVLFFTLPDC